MRRRESQNRRSPVSISAATAIRSASGPTPSGRNRPGISVKGSQGAEVVLSPEEPDRRAALHHLPCDQPEDGRVTVPPEPHTRLGIKRSSQHDERCDCRRKKKDVGFFRRFVVRDQRPYMVADPLRDSPAHEAGAGARHRCRPRRAWERNAESAIESARCRLVSRSSSTQSSLREGEGSSGSPQRSDRGLTPLLLFLDPGRLERRVLPHLGAALRVLASPHGAAISI
jgi:hypothetical protein